MFSGATRFERENRSDMNSFRPSGTRLSGSELRRLLQLREKVKVESLHLPRPLQHRLLELLEASRPWQVQPQAVPEMSRGELIRAIRWRLGTIPLAGAVAAAEFVERHRIRRREQGLAPGSQALRGQAPRGQAPAGRRAR